MLSKGDISKICNPNFHLKKHKKRENQIKSKFKNNEKSMKQKSRKVEKVNETQSWFFDKISEGDKLLDQTRKRKDTNTSSIHEKGDIKMYLTFTKKKKKKAAVPYTSLYNK